MDAVLPDISDPVDRSCVHIYALGGAFILMVPHFYKTDSAQYV